MATKTLGTNANNTLTAVQWSPDPSSLSNADLAAIQIGILDDRPAVVDATGQLVSGVVKGTLPIYPGAFTRDGMLYVPNRGFLRLQPGDWVGFDALGWPILVSAVSIAGLTGTATSWTHT